jgi:hypothetical protein
MQKKDHHPHTESVKLPWSKWLRFRKGVRHARTLDELRLLAQEDEIAATHLHFLLHAADELKKHSLAPWHIVYAVGPFSGMKSVRKVVPTVTVANFRRPYRHLVLLSRAFANPFSEFEILPDIYLLSRHSYEYLESVEHPVWNKTLETSIPLFER